MTGMDTEAAFTSSDTWIRVSPKLVTARRISLALATIPAIALIVVLLLVPGVPRSVPFILIAASIIVYIWAWWLIGRRVRSYAYCERSDDLLVSSGILFRRLVIVPYGRMQLVDVKAGPIDRALGVTTVQLHTAAATTDATIPGLEPEVAAAVRDRLARRGESRSAGL
ncbi:MAG: PH domain-containing protein [Candidatus Nanopelagicales bacterium]|jgi:membrane protein YdbS with pleckstrin-like domain